MLFATSGATVLVVVLLIILVLLIGKGSSLFALFGRSHDWYTRRNLQEAWTKVDEAKGKVATSAQSASPAGTPAAQTWRREIEQLDEEVCRRVTAVWDELRLGNGTKSASDHAYPVNPYAYYILGGSSDDNQGQRVAQRGIDRTNS